MIRSNVFPCKGSMVFLYHCCCLCKQVMKDKHFPTLIYYSNSINLFVDLLKSMFRSLLQVVFGGNVASSFQTLNLMMKLVHLTSYTNRLQLE